jgi:SAM-dependent methyltransferase
VAPCDDVGAVRAAYDATADAYAARVGTELSPAVEGPIDRALLAAFAEMARGVPAGRVADLGCGPGRAAAFLASQGLDVIGIDVSPAILTVARAAHPDIELREGRLTDLPVPDRSLAAIVCWYSIIHTPPAHLDVACAELARARAADGLVLVAFQAGDGDRVDRRHSYGRSVSLTSYRHAPDHVAGCLAAAGLAIHARTVREPELAHESARQAFLLARRARRRPPPPAPGQPRRSQKPAPAGSRMSARPPHVAPNSSYSLPGTDDQ